MKDINKSDAPLGYTAVAASRNHLCEECDMFYMCLTYSKRCDARYREDKQNVIFKKESSGSDKHY